MIGRLLGAMAVTGSLGLGIAAGIVSQDNAGETDNPIIEIEGVEGADGATVPLENTIESVNEVHGSVETIRGIEGIDSVMLQNLEAVLRMQQRPQESQSQGGARAAAGRRLGHPFRHARHRFAFGS